jgi:hypothetical protein
MNALWQKRIQKEKERPNNGIIISLDPIVQKRNFGVNFNNFLSHYVSETASVWIVEDFLPCPFLYKKMYKLSSLTKDTTAKYQLKYSMNLFYRKIIYVDGLRSGPSKVTQDLHETKNSCIYHMQ